MQRMVEVQQDGDKVAIPPLQQIWSTHPAD
jgi:hypothetical protein